jgi:hypothetical protein
MLTSWRSSLLDRLSYVEHHPILTLLLVLLVFVGYYLAGLIVRRIVPGLVDGLLVPVLDAVLDLVVVTLLAVQALLAAPFRLVRLRPPGALYLLGDGVLALSSAGKRLLSVGGRQVWRLRRLGTVGLLLVVLAGLLGWHYRSCSTDGQSASCRAPASASMNSMRHLWYSVWHVPLR